MSASEADRIARLELHQTPLRGVVLRKARRLGRSVRVGGQQVYLTPTEYRLLKVLRNRPSHDFKRGELAALVMPDSVVLDRTIDVHVKSLRRKLAGGRECIETVYGVGYRLAAK